MKRLALIAILFAQGVLSAQAPDGVITGRVLGIDGKPAAGVRVAAASPNTNGEITAETLVAITTTDATGQYRIENVPPGRYGIIAGAVGSPTFFPGVADRLEARVLTIASGSSMSGLDFALVIPPSAVRSVRESIYIVSGRVVIEGVPPPTNGMPWPIDLSRLMLMLDDLGPDGRRMIMSSFAGAIEADGSVSMRVIDRSYMVSIGLAGRKPLEGFIVKSIVMGSTDLMKEELRVNGPVSGEIVITLAPIP